MGKKTYNCPSLSMDKKVITYICFDEIHEKEKRWKGYYAS
jgi:hypothetical protein